MKLKDNFSTAEVKSFCRRSNFHAWLAVVVTWGIIAFAFAIVALWPNPLTVVLSLVLLGGRILGLGVLMHECGHGTMFKSRSVNNWVGKWLCAGPVFNRIDDYMNNHLKHHAKAGSAEDPDLHRYQNYPVSSAALKRKLFRDMTGRTTINFLRKAFLANNIIKIDKSGKKRFDLRQFFVRMHAGIISNLVLFGILASLGLPHLYLLWVAAYFSFYMLFSRIRNLAEHAVVPDIFDADPTLHTRTMLARWWERLTFAPNHVNYHLEHHLLPSVPKYRLAAFHEALKQKGMLEHAEIMVGYPTLIRKLITQPQPVQA
ncbi:MAG: fatty acid desaturase [SAR86 cluster bacterium]|uniref:Fatty acid desaturase n=1 Tax=SAR86 cluster bacterium TaxID=2030880 RepID=A0A2A5ATH7_9GAMM|nr:MAG: fatty acid desaturase [SAR86 cluster bacterium]